MDHSVIKAVSFDAAGTLIQLAEPVGTSYSTVAATFGVSVTPDALNRVFGTVWKRTPPPFSEDAADHDPHEKAWWGRLVREVFTEAGATIPDEATFAEFFEALYLHFEIPGTWLAVPGAKETAEKVATSHRCVVFSNFDGRLRRVLADLDLLAPFESLYLSCEMRLSKPDPRAFATVATGLGLTPAEILHVGDDPRCDWEGARAAGFPHFRVGSGQRNISELLSELSLA